MWVCGQIDSVQLPRRLRLVSAVGKAQRWQLAASPDAVSIRQHTSAFGGWEGGELAVSRLTLSRLRSCPGAIKALLRPYKGSFKALFRRYAGSIEALLRLF